MTSAVRALRRLYPNFKEMPIFARAVDEKHRRKLATAGSIALETGPQELALLLGGSLLNSLGFPREEVYSTIDDLRNTVFENKMGSIFGDDDQDNPILKLLKRSAPTRPSPSWSSQGC